MKKTLHPWQANLLMLVCTIVLFFAVIEILLRLTIDNGIPRTPPIYQKSEDPELSYELKPSLSEYAFRSTIETDRRGLRSSEIHPGKKTVALLGDSIAFGYGLENDQTIGAQMNVLLPNTYNIVTAAAPGYSLGQEAALYRTKIAQLHPGTLVLIFHWNDLTLTQPDILDDDGNLHPPDWVPGTSRCSPMVTGILKMFPGQCWLDLHSAFYRTVKKIISARTEQENALQQTSDLTQDAFDDYVTDDQIQKYGNELASFSRSLPRDLSRLFVIWPERPLHFAATADLMTLAKQSGFETLNLYEVFGNRGETLSWDTVHPSAKTAEEAAAVIVSALRTWDLLPR